MKQKSNQLRLRVFLENISGSLCRFLMPFQKANINLSLIDSEPMEGYPDQTTFFIIVDSKDKTGKVLNEAQKYAKKVIFASSKRHGSFSFKRDSRKMALNHL